MGRPGRLRRRNNGSHHRNQEEARGLSRKVNFSHNPQF
jgi:hypothetical protein